MTRPSTIADIPTPALIIDLPAMERNIHRMAQFFADGPCKLRPHFKAHKTPEIARRQLAAGSCTGLTCATVGEAEVIAEFCDNILIANQVIGREKCRRVAELAKRVDFKVAVDSVEGLEQMAAAARNAGATVGVLVEVNVGFRAGVGPGGAALELARRVIETAGLEFRGLVGYEGAAVGIDERAQREAATRQALERLLTTVSVVEAGGISCEIVSAGGTGTYDITGRMEGVTEIQAGSYVLMDCAYAKQHLPFERACSVLGTVVSRPSPTMVTADCGHKSCTQDHGNPEVKGLDGASVVFLADEHAMIGVTGDCPLRPGDRIELWPSHIDPTINLHDVFYVVEGDAVVDVWPISARGYLEQREQLR